MLAIDVRLCLLHPSALATCGSEANGLSVAVDIIEQSLGVTRNSLPSRTQSH